MVLAIEDSQRTLYLAVPSEVYKDFFTRPFAQASIQTNQLKLIVYEISTEAEIFWYFLSPLSLWERGRG